MYRDEYFKGMYFKCEDEGKTVALIPGVRQFGGKRGSFLQIITDDGAWAVDFKEKDGRNGGCHFDMSGAVLNIKRDDLKARGVLRFSSLTPPRYDIMGPFKYIPFMQCRHTVYSMRHRVDGMLNINGNSYIFQNGNGYIEGDSGHSFPKKYIWTHCRTDKCALMLSVASIPLGALSFVGVIGFVLIGKKEYRIATYLGAQAERISDGCVTVRQGDYTLHARLIKKNAHPLLAPRAGRMSRTIHESASCTAEYVFCERGQKIFEFVSDRASFESEL